MKVIPTLLRNRKSARFTSPPPANLLSRIISTGLSRYCIRSSTSRRARLSPISSVKIRSAPWPNGGWPCRTITACGATETRPPGPLPWARQNRSPPATRRLRLGKAPTSMPWLKFIGKTVKIALRTVRRSKGKWVKCRRPFRKTPRLRSSTLSRWPLQLRRRTKPLPINASAEKFWNLLFARQPHHPGIAHYMIHCCDNPVLAERGLGAALMYAKIAPASAHANHMPSHLFTRVGSWDESIASNTKSAGLAAAEATSANGEARDQRLHAMDYQEYADLQSGRIKQAKAVLEEMNALPPVTGLTLTGGYALAAIPARYANELGDWEQASHLSVQEEGVLWAQAITWAAIGIGSARTKNLDRARQ